LKGCLWLIQVKRYGGGGSDGEPPREGEKKKEHLYMRGKRGVLLATGRVEGQVYRGGGGGGNDSKGRKRLVIPYLESQSRVAIKRRRRYGGGLGGGREGDIIEESY